jgi:hypothetical protein
MADLPEKRIHNGEARSDELGIIEVGHELKRAVSRLYDPLREGGG